MREIVDIIGELKYEINNTLKLQEKELMFVPSYEDSIRMKTLGKPCTNKNEMQAFSTTLYTVVYEETKNEKFNKVRLGRFRNHIFTFYVSELRHYYDHGYAEYISNKRVKAADIFRKYLGKTVAPKTADEFQKIQEGILNDFIDFLNEINENVGSETKEKLNPVTGIIEIDNKGIAHCGEVFLSPKFKEYNGHNCIISNTRKNSNDVVKEKYPLFINGTVTIEINIEGIIAIDKDGYLHVQGILLPDNLKSEVGKKVIVKEIKVLYKPISIYNAKALKWDLIKIYKKKPENQKKESMTIPSIPLGVDVKVELDSLGRTFVGNIYW